LRNFAPAEETANAIVHGLGAALSVAALVVLVVTASVRGSAWQIVACSIYGASLVLLYMCSTLYHALPEGRAKRVFLVMDHCAIYVLIAGTYTPFTLVTMRGGWGWSIFGVVWGLAAAGIVYQCFLVGRMPILSTAIYILMGWSIIIALGPLLGALPWLGFLWLLAGGLAYTLGVIFFALKFRYSHAIWHAFVLAGSIFQFVAVYEYVLARRM
jgi:hemolysin III